MSKATKYWDKVIEDYHNGVVSPTYEDWIGAEGSGDGGVAEKDRSEVIREYTMVGNGGGSGGHGGAGGKWEITGGLGAGETLTVTSSDQLDKEVRAYDFRARLATRLASKFVDRLFQGQDLIVTSDTANAVFDKLADAFMELEDNVLIDLVYDTGGEPLDFTQEGISLSSKEGTR